MVKSCHVLPWCGQEQQQYSVWSFLGVLIEIHQVLKTDEKVDFPFFPLTLLWNLLTNTETCTAPGKWLTCLLHLILGRISYLMRNSLWTDLRLASLLAGEQVLGADSPDRIVHAKNQTSDVWQCCRQMICRCLYICVSVCIDICIYIWTSDS